MKTKTLKKLDKCFKIFAKDCSVPSPGFLAHYCWLWKNPIMSPLFFEGKRLTTKKLEQLESWHNKNKDKSPYSTNNPYINLLAGKKDLNQNEIAKQLEKHGWSKSEIDAPNHYMLWENIVESTPLPKGLYIKYGDYRANKQLLDLFNNSMMKSFGLDLNFCKVLAKMIKSLDSSTKIVLICNQKNDVVASGLVTTHEGHSFLYCDSVMPRYRNKSLWTSLLHARQVVSYGEGSRVWLSSSTNKFIQNKGEINIPFKIYYKTTK